MRRLGRARRERSLFELESSDGAHDAAICEATRVRRRLRGTDRLRDLELLRRWDVAGRDPRAIVCPVGEAVDAILLEAVTR